MSTMWFNYPANFPIKLSALLPVGTVTVNNALIGFWSFVSLSVAVKASLRGWLRGFVDKTVMAYGILPIFLFKYFIWASADLVFEDIFKPFI